MIEKLLKLIEFIKYGKKKFGLRDITDDRNFGSRAVYTPTKEDLAEAKKQSFVVFDPPRLDQLDSDFCVGFGGAYEADATEYFNGDSGQGSGTYVLAMAKKWSGEPYNSYGTSLLAGAMARVTFGICNKELYDYKKGMRDWFSKWENIPKEAHEDAAKHKAGSAWQLDIPWGWTKFDAILATLWHFKDKRVLIGTGDEGHRRTIFGYDKVKNCLLSADTYGNRTYQNGTQFIDEIRARTLFTPYFVLDIERSLAEILVKYNGKLIKLSDNVDCYLVKEGKKCLVPDEDIAWSHGLLLAPYDNGKLVEIIEKDDFNKIPNGDNLKFEGGKNEWIIKRIKEKYKI